MSKINRFNGNLQPFALNASSGARYVFGNDAVTGNDLDSNITADFIKGWENGTVTDAGGNDYPPMSFFNALGYTSTALSAYLHQVGVPDYNALQEYYEGSLTNVDGVLYASKTGEEGMPNVGNNPATDRDNWKAVNVPDVDTIADLRALTSTPDRVWLSGYHTKNDGAFGSNIFRWEPTSTKDDNGGTIVKLDSVATGRYELQYDSAVNVKWLGAVGDGVTDDTVAIQNAINSSSAVFFPLGSYKVTSQLVGKTKLQLIGAYSQLQETGADSSVGIFSTIADLGDGVAIFKPAPSTTQIQSILIENIKFQGDLTIDHQDLSATGTTGIVGVDVSGIKQGLLIKNCTFKKLLYGLKAVSGHGYTGHTMLDKCNFYLCRNGFDFSPSTGIGMSDCTVYDCYAIGNTNRVTADNLSLNASSYGDDTDSHFSFENGVFSNLWIEGYNNTLQPSRYLEVNNAYFSESYDSGLGYTKHTIRPQGNGVAITLKGCRVGTNTRLFNLSSVTDFTTVSIELQRCYNGTNFGDATYSDVYEFTERGGKFLGSLNDNADWNFGVNLGSILGGVDLDTSDTTNYHRMPNLFRKVYWSTSISFTLDFQSSLEPLEPTPPFSDYGAEYAEFTIVGFNNGAGGTVAYYAKIKILNGYGNTWDYVIEGRDAASYGVVLNAIDKYTCEVTISETHAGSGEYLIFNGSTSSGKIKFN